jgi:HPt (histidine-containing phosphotransfer) domain-containing protein
MDLPVVDKAEALSRLDGDLELWEEIREIWLSDVGSLIESVEAALNSRSAEALRRAAHALKGASANVGATRVSTKAREVEGSAPGADWPALEALVAALRLETETARRELPSA